MARRNLSADTVLLAQLATMDDAALQRVADVAYSILQRRRKQAGAVTVSRPRKARKPADPSNE